MIDLATRASRGEVRFAGGPDDCRGCTDLRLPCATGAALKARRCTCEERAPMTSADGQA